MAVNDQDSNDVVLSYAEEVVGTIGTLPGTPNWYGREPNSFSDLGGDPSLVSRSPIGTRKRLTGSVTAVDAKGGWNEDFTQTNFSRLLQGFFCADIAHEISTQPFNGTQIPITSVAAVDESYNAGAGMTIFKNNMLVMASGFTNAANNGLKRATADATGTKLIVVPATLVIEASPPAAAKLEVVGIMGAAGDLALTYAAPVLTLTSTALDFTTLGLSIGEWIFLGGDNAINKFATRAPAYCRIASIAAHAIVFDKTTMPAIGADAGAGQKIYIFFGRYLRDPATAKVRTYQLERKLGNDGAGIQTEYVIGAFPNEFSLNVKQQSKLDADLSFMGIDYAQQTGTTGPKSGNRFAAAGEPALNTSSDVLRLKLAVVDPTTLEPSPYFGYVTDAALKLTNNGDVNNAVGATTGFDVNVGEFDFGGNLTAYFTTIAAIQAIRNHTLATFDAIFARANAGWVIDIPLLELSGGIVKPEKNKPVMVPINKSGVLNPNGYVAHMNVFTFLPQSAMPVANQAGVPLTTSL